MSNQFNKWDASALSRAGWLWICRCCVSASRSRCWSSLPRRTRAERCPRSEAAATAPRPPRLPTAPCGCPPWRGSAGGCPHPIVSTDPGTDKTGRRRLYYSRDRTSTQVSNCFYLGISPDRSGYMQLHCLLSAVASGHDLPDFRLIYGRWRGERGISRHWSRDRWMLHSLCMYCKKYQERRYKLKVRGFITAPWELKGWMWWIQAEPISDHWISEQERRDRPTEQTNNQQSTTHSKDCVMISPSLPMLAAGRWSWSAGFVATKNKNNNSWSTQHMSCMQLTAGLAHHRHDLRVAAGVFSVLLFEDHENRFLLGETLAHVSLDHRVVLRPEGVEHVGAVLGLLLRQ